jgi:hypothetical protein
MHGSANPRELFAESLSSRNARARVEVAVFPLFAAAFVLSPLQLPRSGRKNARRSAASSWGSSNATK